VRFRLWLNRTSASNNLRQDKVRYVRLDEMSQPRPVWFKASILDPQARPLEG